MPRFYKQAETSRFFRFVWKGVVIAAMFVVALVFLGVQEGKPGYEGSTLFRELLGSTQRLLTPTVVRLGFAASCCVLGVAGWLAAFKFLSKPMKVVLLVVTAAFVAALIGFVWMGLATREIGS